MKPVAHGVRSDRSCADASTGRTNVAAQKLRADVGTGEKIADRRYIAVSATIKGMRLLAFAIAIHMCQRVVGIRRQRFFAGSLRIVPVSQPQVQMGGLKEQSRWRCALFHHASERGERIRPTFLRRYICALRYSFTAGSTSRRQCAASRQAYPARERTRIAPGRTAPHPDPPRITR